MSLESLLRRDRWIVGAGLFAVAALAWAFTIRMALMMSPGMAMDPAMKMDPGMAMAPMAAWGAVDLALLFLMWVVMMIAMMVPTVAPMVLLFADVNRRRREERRPYVPAGVFLLGYAAVWTGFSALATLGQAGLHAAALLSPAMASSSPYLNAGVLAGAGAFQFTPLKNACLAKCRTPLSFIMTEWREGARGALVMGLRHGAFCTGCCWILMAVLFVTGVMNLLAVAAITAFVLAEKAAPWGARAARAGGAFLIGWGVWTATRGALG